jgi:hypothetical protein
LFVVEFVVGVVWRGAAGREREESERARARMAVAAAAAAAGRERARAGAPRGLCDRNDKNSHVAGRLLVLDVLLRRGGGGACGGRDHGAASVLVRVVVVVVRVRVHGSLSLARARVGSFTGKRSRLGARGAQARPY